eukprot:COSAG02_NODE_1422_length_12685_cov_69.610361_5_plen_78_part_00
MLRAAMMALRRHALERAAMVISPRWPGCRAGRGACSVARAQIGGTRSAVTRDANEFVPAVEQGRVALAHELHAAGVS